MNKIFFNSGVFGYSWLSNFYSVPITFEGFEYASVEHAYQAAKFAEPKTRKMFRAPMTAAGAKKLARQLRGELRDDWSAVKVGIMTDLLRQKFSKSDFKEKLLATGEAELIELAPWDGFWGNGKDGKGMNVMGKILMEIRGEIMGDKK